jgi:hypothetical protein
MAAAAVSMKRGANEALAGVFFAADVGKDARAGVRGAHEHRDGECADPLP